VKTVLGMCRIAFETDEVVQDAAEVAELRFAFAACGGGRPVSIPKTDVWSVLCLG
jgi:hypothetical protein